MSGRGKAFHLFNLYGFRVTADWSWLVIVFLLTWSLATGWFPVRFVGQSGATYWGMGLLSSLLLFASVLAHEFGHAYTAVRSGIRIMGIRLFIFGGIAQLEREPHSPDVELKVALAGPTVSAALAVLFCLLSYAPVTMVGAPFLMVAYFLARANLAMAVFNLIPGFPLDGGRVLRALVWKMRHSYYYATKVAAGTGKLVAYGFMAFGLLMIPFGSLANGLWLVFIGLFLHRAAQAAWAQVAFQRFADPHGWTRPFALDELWQVMEAMTRERPRRADPFRDLEDAFRQEPSIRRIRLYF